MWALFFSPHRQGGQVGEGLQVPAAIGLVSADWDADPNLCDSRCRLFLPVLKAQMTTVRTVVVKMDGNIFQKPGCGIRREGQEAFQGMSIRIGM